MTPSTMNAPTPRASISFGFGDDAPRIFDFRGARKEYRVGDVDLTGMDATLSRKT